MGKFAESLNKKLLLVKKNHYHRDQFNTYMNTFEWENVEDSKRIGAFMGEGNSIFHFPFLARAWNLIWVTKNSINSANQYDSKSKILASEYGLMAGFINFFNTLEFVPMGITSFFARFFISEKNPTPMQQHFANYFKEYGLNLETVPFYDHDYAAIRAQLSEAYQTEKVNQSITFADRLTYLVVGAQLIFRSLVSGPLHYMYHQPENMVPPTTDVLVRYNVKNAENGEEAKQIFKEKLNEIKDKAQVEIVDEHVYAKEKNPDKNYISTYALLSTPRYRAFKETTTLLREAQIEIKKIAGNDNIQVKCEVNAKSEDEFIQSLQALDNAVDAAPLYKYGDSIHPYYQTCLFNVPVKQLQKTVCQLDEAHNDAKVSFIHNF